VVLFNNSIVSGHKSKLAKLTGHQSTIYLHFVKIAGLQFTWKNC